ncbi:MAG: hypothetical protein Q9193_005412 [Seirophora villosa]
MPSIKNILILAFAATVSAQAVSQLPDGQLQGPTSTVAPITQIPDGQLQAPTGVSSGIPVPTANGTFAPGAPAPFTGGAALVTFSGAAVGLAALAAML